MQKIRKEVHLTKEVVEAVQKKADAENRSWKQWVEILIEKASKDKIIQIK